MSPIITVLCLQLMHFFFSVVFHPLWYLPSIILHRGLFQNLSTELLLEESISTYAIKCAINCETSILMTMWPTTPSR